MLSEQDQQFIVDADQAIRQFGTVEEAAAALDMNPNTFYSRVRRCGYQIVKDSRLEPIHGMPLDESGEVAA